MWSMEGTKFPMGSSRREAQEIHVLLVDPDKPTLAATARMLEFLSYQVTAVPSGSDALLILSDHCKKINLVLADVRLPDINGFILLHETVQREVTTILMLAHEDPIVTRLALENGATFVLHKPVSASVLKNLWQHVVSSDVLKSITTGDIDSSIETVNNDKNSFDDPAETVSEEIISKEKGSSSKRKKSRDTHKKKARKVRKKKASTEWTDELHGLFVNAVKQLGDGRCYPKEILQLMNVSGLTRMQVASHLQKCRDGRWRGPEMRKGNATFSSNSASHSATRRFGAMPPLEKITSNPPTPSPQIGKTLTTTRDSSRLGKKIASTSSSDGTSAANQLFNKLAKVGETRHVVDRHFSKVEPVSPKKGKEEY